MKVIFLTIFFLFSGINFVQAQTYESVGILQPVERTKVKKSKTKIYAVESLPLTPIDFALNIEVVLLRDSVTGFRVVIKVSNREIAFDDKNEPNAARLRIFARVMSENKNVSIFEEKLYVTLDKSYAESMKESINYRKAFELPPGKYKIDVILTDEQTGSRGIKTLRVEIPDSASLKSSTI